MSNFPENGLSVPLSRRIKISSDVRFLLTFFIVLNYLIVLFLPELNGESFINLLTTTRYLIQIDTLIHLNHCLK